VWGEQQKEKRDCINSNVPEDGLIRLKYAVRKTCGVFVPYMNCVVGSHNKEINYSLA
jgi:hypothetical protein